MLTVGLLDGFGIGRVVGGGGDVLFEGASQSAL